jgi:hypothetical protein
MPNTRRAERVLGCKEGAKSHAAQSTFISVHILRRMTLRLYYTMTTNLESI